ncbi:MAG: putative lipid II flippase FtsW [Mariprofundaceae bacterium]|nr:putative lipid II flippase FtsW [Mariprofundaceae bacterium]
MSNRIAPPDRVITGCILLLLTLSIVMIGSASLSVAEARFGDPLRIISHWVVYIPVGLLLAWGVSRVHPDWWKAASLPLLGLMLLLMLCLLAFGVKINGATRWFSLAGMTLQPVELLKPVVILYLAYYMAAFPDRLKSFASGLSPMLVVVSTAAILLLLQPDFGNAALLIMVAFCMWFVGGVPFRHLLALISIAIPIGAIAVIVEPYRLKRILSFTDPWADPFGSGYQLIQSMIAFGSGGISGSGLGQSVQKLFYLPEAFTDFIAAVLAEELGLAGTLALITLFMVLIWRGLKLAMQTKEPFERLLILGCILLIAISCMINLGAVMGILPTKGMPIPFFSYGGSALFGNCILIGLILSVQRHQPENRPLYNSHTAEAVA